MAQWLVMRGDVKIPAASLADIEAMARQGKLSSGDMVQPPGTTEWLYVGEVPELKAVLDRGYDDDDDQPSNRGFIGGAALVGIAAILGVGFLVVILAGGGTMMWIATQLDDDNAGLMAELRYSQMLVTAHGAALRSDPVGSAKISQNVNKDDLLELLAKRGEFYRARTASGVEGWIPQDQVIPLYQLGDRAVQDEYDPLYNPDKYVTVSNARWMQLPKEKAGPMELSNITIFEFQMMNLSRYPMTDLKILATIKDAQGHELERIEIPIEGMIPAHGDTMVGTLTAEVEPAGKRRAPKPDAAPDRILTTSTFDEMAQTDPEMQLRYTSGVEIEMTSENFANAEIDVVELRAVPDAKATVAVRQ